jgi:hypothetical protein
MVNTSTGTPAADSPATPESSLAAASTRRKPKYADTAAADATTHRTRKRICAGNAMPSLPFHHVRSQMNVST